MFSFSVWTLKEVCIQHIRRLMTDAEIGQLELPRDLIRDVLTKEDRAHGVVFFYNPAT